MQQNDLTFAFCLHEIAHNISEHNTFGMRIGKSCLSFVSEEEYEVIDWNGNHSYHTDLADAIRRFIKVNNRRC